MPALLTRTSIRPNCSLILEKNPATSLCFRTSHVLHVTRAPALTSRATASSRRVLSLPLMATFQPASAKASAMPKPMPRLPPVMTASLCCVLVLIGSSATRKTPSTHEGHEEEKRSASDAVGLLADEGEELFARLLFVAEGAEHRRRHRRGVLLLDPAHHHAEVARLDDDADALRLDDFLDRLG